MIKYLFSISLFIGFTLFCSAEEKTAEYVQEDITPIKQDKKAWKKIVDGKDFSETPEKKKEKKKKKPSDFNLPSLNIGQAGKVFLFSLVILLLAFIIYKLIANSNYRANKKVKKIRLVDIDDIEQNLDKADVDPFLFDAINQENYRLAIRLYYLKVLKHLMELEWIKWKKDKTNSEYLRELYSKEFYTDFRLLTLMFERVWYGEVVLDDVTFKTVEQNFTSSISMLNAQKTLLKKDEE